MKYYFLIIISLISCRPSKSLTGNGNSEYKKINIEPQITIYFFKASKTWDNGITIELINQKRANGVLKEKFSNEILAETLKKNSWILTFLDNAKQNIIQLQIDNPLIENVEFANDDNAFERKTITHATKEFIIRIPLKSTIKAIQFENISDTNKKLSKQLFQKIEL